MGLLLITHDLGVVGQHADRVIVMHDGHALESQPTRALIDRPQHPYSRGLLQASLGAEHDQHYLNNRLAEINIERQPGQATRYSVNSSHYGPGRKPRAPAGNPALLKVSDLTTGYGDSTVLNRISLEVGERESVGLVGESGCGKSTLSRTLLRLLPARSGTVEFDGRDIASLAGEELLGWRRQVQMIFQDPYAALNPRHSVETILDRVQRLHGQNDPGQRQQARLAMLDAVGLARSSLARLPHQFSGGQRQRIGIARALILKPRLVICDEPVSALDVSTQAQILNLLVELREELGLSYLFISHDLSVVRYFADRILVMEQGQIVEQATPHTLWHSPRHPYTRRLLAAIPGAAAPSPPPLPVSGLRFAVGW
nr:ATP-binding cassette domain-containing protein [Pseudomonas sp. CCI3.1]